MSVFDETPLERVLAKLVQVECKLKKCPDFQLYLLAKSANDRGRRKRLLLEIPSFTATPSRTWIETQRVHPNNSSLV